MMQKIVLFGQEFTSIEDSNTLNHALNIQAWWSNPIIPALRGLGHKDREFEANTVSGYIASSG